MVNDAEDPCGAIRYRAGSTDPKRAVANSILAIDDQEWNGVPFSGTLEPRGQRKRTRSPDIGVANDDHNGQGW